MTDEDDDDDDDDGDDDDNDDGNDDEDDDDDDYDDALLPSSNLSGLSKYQSAVDAGLAGQDCSLLYSQCPLSYARAFTSLL